MAVPAVLLGVNPRAIVLEPLPPSPIQADGRDPRRRGRQNRNVGICLLGRGPDAMVRVHHARVVAVAEMAVKVLPLDRRVRAVALITTIRIALKRFSAKVRLDSSRREDGIEVHFET